MVSLWGKMSETTTVQIRQRTSYFLQIVSSLRPETNIRHFANGPMLCNVQYLRRIDVTVQFPRIINNPTVRLQRSNANQKCQTHLRPHPVPAPMITQNPAHRNRNPVDFGVNSASPLPAVVAYQQLYPLSLTAHKHHREATTSGNQPLCVQALLALQQKSRITKKTPGSTPTPPLRMLTIPRHCQCQIFPPSKKEI